MNSETDINFENIDSEQKDLEVDASSYKINTYGADMTLEILAKKIRDKEIIIPTFQRKYVWSPKKASKLIESFLLGLPVPQIFLYRDDETQDLLVVDGQQRLKSILYFFDGSFDDGTEFRLKGVKEQWEGKRFEQLNSVDQRKLNNYILRASIFEQLDPLDKSSVYEIFERLNTGGVSLNPQEIRNCVIMGNISEFLEKLNEYSNWRLLLGKDQADKRMKDVEMILRFLSLLKNRGGYKEPMKDFISLYMKSKKNLNDGDKAELTDIFTSTIDFIYREIGENAFRIKGGINNAVFDSISVAVATIGPINITDGLSKYKKLIADENYLLHVKISTTGRKTIEARIDLAIKYLSQ